MGFTLIKGTFHVVGYSPDGDSIRFKANRNENWVKVNGNVKLNKNDHAQLRFQAIDTLETHYKKQHQPEEFAEGAMQFLLNAIEITDVVWNETKSRIQSANDGTRGYVLCRESEKYGRPIAFVFAGETELEDGQNVFLDGEYLKNSLNYKMITSGYAYPTYYFGLFYDLRQTFTEATVESRTSNIGLYNSDKTNTGFIVSSLDSITQKHVILPKLFRRLVAHLLEHDNVDNFIEELKLEREKVFLIDKAHDTYFDTLIQVEDGEVRMTEEIENLMFLG